MDIPVNLFMGDIGLSIGSILTRTRYGSRDFGTPHMGLLSFKQNWANDRDGWFRALGSHIWPPRVFEQIANFSIKREWVALEFRPGFFRIQQGLNLRLFRFEMFAAVR